MSTTLTAGTWYGWVPNGVTNDGLSSFGLWKIVIDATGNVDYLYTDDAEAIIDKGGCGKWT